MILIPIWEVEGTHKRTAVVNHGHQCSTFSSSTSSCVHLSRLVPGHTRTNAIREGFRYFSLLMESRKCINYESKTRCEEPPSMSHLRISLISYMVMVECWRVQQPWDVVHVSSQVFSFDGLFGANMATHVI